MKPRNQLQGFFSAEDDAKIIEMFEKKHESLKGQHDKIIEKIAELEKNIEQERNQTCIRSIRGPDLHYLHNLELEKQILEKMDADTKLNKPVCSL